ncbi:hypothetical protein B0J11DRAFT_589460 [Dendryphion nanum]|uniref:BTB domain-containing protein n=1 Tax=Dendryphion nanum TaxID=256645 RepID=A0A9P9ELD6_9PLEO|nr:hypothetical protein B0J11DRAFT_589460 [Dendryphion nanum]
MEDASRQILLASLKELLQSGNYSDLTITCGQDIYKAHKVIICSRTAFFANAIRFPGKESKEATIDLPEDEPATIKLLMQYMYEGEYHPFHVETSKPSDKTILQKQTAAHSCRDQNFCCENYGNIRVCDHHFCGVQYRPKFNGTASQLLVHSKMYEIGERYDVQGLKELAKEKFRIACDEFWNTSDFPEAAYHAFSSTVADDKGLRTIVCQILANHMELINKEEIVALLMEFNGLAYGLLKEKIIHGWK